MICPCQKDPACQDCGGCGVAHCCEGLMAQPEYANLQFVSSRQEPAAAFPERLAPSSIEPRSTCIP